MYVACNHEDLSYNRKQFKSAPDSYLHSGSFYYIDEYVDVNWAKSVLN